jgi:hypothetical protein
MNDDTFKEMAAHEEATTKDVTGPLAISPELLAAPKKKRAYNRKVKPVAVAPVVVQPEAEREWYCATCRETISDRQVMRMGAGDNRFAVFCPTCQKSFGFEDKIMHETVAGWIKNNPTGK